MAALVVAPVSSRREEIAEALAQLDCDCQFANADSVFEMLRRRSAPELFVVVTDPSANQSDSLDCLQRLHGAAPGAHFLFVASESSEELAIGALHAGADRYLRGPWTAGDLRCAAQTLLQASTVNRRESRPLSGGERLIGRSKAMQSLRAQLACVAPTNSNVLVTGETGTGKELVAELIHANGLRADKPFVCINTAAMPETLAESELFGHERGAFTGATTAQSGKLAAANTGTVFLDEIGDVPLAVQAKLLRAIENKTIYRVGAIRPVNLDVRLIAATHQNLESAVVNGKFRQDLYYRLNVVRVQLPALRDRAEDIPPLIQHFIRRFNRELGRGIRGFSVRALDALKSYHWPGNIRELRNVVEAVIANLSPDTTGIVDVPPSVMRQLAVAVGAPTTERDRLLHALTETNWNKSKAAERLHCSRMTLYRKMHQHELMAPKELS